jgi:hypothetical protein
MHVREGRPGSFNDGCDPMEELKMNAWSQVKVTQAKGVLKVFINNELVCENHNYGKSDPGRHNVIVYGSDPWHHVSRASIRNVKYVQGVQAADSKAKLPESLKRSKVIATVTTLQNYMLSFKIKPLQKVNGWSNVFHFTANNQNNGPPGSRIPAIWFFSGTTRMHVRQGRPGSTNDGCDKRSVAAAYLVQCYGEACRQRVDCVCQW